MIQGHRNMNTKSKECEKTEIFHCIKHQQVFCEILERNIPLKCIIYTKTQSCLIRPPGRIVTSNVINYSNEANEIILN